MPRAADGSSSARTKLLSFNSNRENVNKDHREILFYIIRLVTIMKLVKTVRGKRLYLDIATGSLA